MYKEELEIEVTLEHKGSRLDQFLFEVKSELTRNYIQRLIDEGNIEIVGKKKTKSGNKLKGNEKILVKIPEDEVLEVEAEDIPINIVYEDEYLVVLNKEAGMVVHPASGNYTGTLVNAIMHHIKDLSSINGVIRPGIVHRLDKNTSGLIIIAKTDEAHVKLTEMFKEKTIDKTYLCICKGIFREKSGRVESLIGRNPKERKQMAVVERNGKIAITNYQVLEEGVYHSFVKVGIETGRTHQIRVHMKGLNHPILGDEVYGRTSKHANRQMLHAYKLEFIHPITKKEMKIVGELPEDFKAVMRSLNLNIDGVEKSEK